MHLEFENFGQRSKLSHYSKNPYFSGDIGSGDYDNRTTGNNTLYGGAGNDSLTASGSTGHNLLSGHDDNDSLSVSGNFYEYFDDESGPSSAQTTLAPLVITPSTVALVTTT